VIRLDGPAGSYTPPPAWATPDLLADAIRLAATRASTKTRAYSTTLGALRAARAAWHRRHTPPASPTTLVLAHWAYDGTGLTPDLERLAALIGGGPTGDQEGATRG
jgi:hypothetical protein